MKKYRAFAPREFSLELLGTENMPLVLTDLGTYGTKADAEIVKNFISSDKVTIALKALE